MRKLSVFATLSLSTVLLVGCSLKRSSHTPPQEETASVSETVEIDDVEVISAKSNEYTHEMAEANAEDATIKQKVGAQNIDEELSGSESGKVPYARNFLLKKNTKRMQFWVDYFTKDQRDRFQRFINNGEEYRHHIQAILRANGLPEELYFVGLIESGYYLSARSHAAAVGPWQFIRGTGLRYGLKINSDIDERRDLFKATHAAAAYFKDLHNIFSSWELALSAYNAGEYGIIRRIMKHGTRDFYQLSKNKQLPTETINYVPKVLAAMHVINNAEKYGFVLPKKSNRLFDKTQLVPVAKNQSLQSIANRLNVNVNLLKKLNPELKRSATPRYFAGTYRLRVPASSDYVYEAPVEAESIRTGVAPITFSRPETRREFTKRVANRPANHKVKRGETLYSIARKYEMSPKEIARLNNLSRSRIHVGQRLALAGNDDAVSVRQAGLKVTNKPIVYKVTRGDNLSDIARIFNSSLAKIKAANKLKRGTIQVGQKIVLPGTQKGIYTVQRGDKLSKVAKEFNQPVAALVKLNALKQKSIRPGQKIIVNID